MKDLRAKIVNLLKDGSCTPLIAQIARKLHEPSTTIHYNIRRLEQDGIIKRYKAVLDHRLLGQPFCAYILINLAPNQYSDPEQVGRALLRSDEVESVDICTGEWELILKVRTRDVDEYYAFVKRVLAKEGVTNITTLTSLKQLKADFIAT